MAKERLTLYDRYGNVIEYDISSASVTIDAEGKSLDIKLSEIATALLQAVTSVTFNGKPYNRENGKINIGDQMQADWNESSASYPTFIKNKPNVVTGIKMGVNGTVNTPSNGVVTLPEPGSQATFDNAMSSESENGVQNKVIKAYVDNLINGLINGAPAALDTLNELSAALGNDSNFAATITNALAAKANSSDIYTKTEVDDKVANAGKVKSVTVNGTNHTPNSSGIVDLGTIQGTKGDKGDKGDTVVIDPEGLEQFEIVNDLDTSDPTQGLSARQGKILKQAISTVQANLQAVVDALANMAFTSAKPTMSQIDWTGGTFYATIVKNLTGCTATDNTNNGQIVEGQTLTMQLTANSGFTLTGAAISVTNSKGQSVAYTLTGSTLTVANVTGTITVSVVAVAVFSVVNNDANVNLTANTMSPTSGSSWTGTLAIKSGISNYRLASAPVVTMGGTAVDFSASGNSWNQSTGVMTIGNVTGNIVISSASVEMVAHRVANHFINMASTGDGYVEDGDDYTAVLSPTTGATSNGDLRVFVDGTPLEATDYTFDSATGALTIPAAKITGDVDVCATASTGKITVTVKAGMSTTVEFKQNQWASAFYSDTIDASESAEDVTVVIDTVPKVNGIPTVTLWTFGTPAAIKSLDFGGCKTFNNGNHSTFSGLSSAESISGLAYVETPNNGAVQITEFFKNCSSLSGTLDLMTWRCDTGTNPAQVANGCTADEIIMPYMPNLTNAKNTLQRTGIKRFTMNKTGAISVISNFAQDAPNLKFVDLSRANITSAVTNIEFFFCGTTPNGITLKIGEFDLSGVTKSTLHSINTKVSKLICITTTPPNSALLNYLGSSVEIYVPNSAVDAYKTAWASKASNIHPVSEYTE